MDGDEGSAERRQEPLSRPRIVEAAVSILDRDGTATAGTSLTLRALMTHLRTGAGAIYHHVATMDELRAAAADAVLGPRLEAAEDGPDVRENLRSAAAAIFDALLAHAWLGPQLSRQPLQPAVLRIWGTMGRCLQQLDVPPGMAADAGSTLVAFVLGAAIQQAAGPGQVESPDQRRAALDRIAAQMTADSADTLTAQIAAQVRDHDDREQFLAGIDLILAGLTASSQG